MATVLKLKRKTDVSMKHFQRVTVFGWLLAQGDGAEWAGWTLCWSLKLGFVQFSSHTLTLTSY